MDDEPFGKRERNRMGGLWWGLGLIFLGAIFLLQAVGVIKGSFNWWAIFILIPAFTALSGAWFAFKRSEGTFNVLVRNGLGGGLIILTVGLMFLFNLDWGIWWPLMLIVPGFNVMLNGKPDPALVVGVKAERMVTLALWIGAGMILLGGGFLVQNLGIADLHTLSAPFRWWAIAILIPAVGGFYNAWKIYQHDQQVSWAVRSLAGFGAICLIVGGVAFIGIPWVWLFPLILIGIGVAILLSAFNGK